MEKKADIKPEEVKGGKYQALLETIEKMSVLELSELVKALEERLGVSASTVAMPVSGIQAPPAGEQAQIAAAEKTSFNVVIKNAGLSKIQVIKAVKEITGKGLTEAKELTEKLPSTIKEAVKKEEAEAVKKKLEEAGATVVLE